MPCQQSVCWGGLAGRRGWGGGEKEGENHFMGDTVKDLFERAASLRVLLH